MWPTLFHLPAWLLLIAGGILSGALLAGGEPFERKRAALGAAAGAVLALAIGGWRGWLPTAVPVHGYGTFILAGFLLGVFMSRRRAHLLGVDPERCMDVGVLGVVTGLAGARVFHILFDNWSYYNPFGERGPAAVLDMFKVWEGGLVFYGAFLVVIPVTAWYCRRHKIPVLPFLDLAAPALIAGLALGRLGCLMRGCCYGCPVEWGIVFGPESPAWEDHVIHGWISTSAARSLPVHPTQIYAFLCAGLTAAFLYAYWPRRKYDGQILGLMLLMAGATRFFEEALRGDTPAAWPELAPSLSMAQWIGLSLVAISILWLHYFRRRGSLYLPAPAPAAS